MKFTLTNFNDSSERLAGALGFEPDKAFELLALSLGYGSFDQALGAMDNETVPSPAAWLGLNCQETVALISAVAFHDPRVPLDQWCVQGIDLLRLVVQDIFFHQTARPITLSSLGESFLLDQIEKRCWQNPDLLPESAHLQMYLTTLPTYRKERFNEQSETANKHHNSLSLPSRFAILRLEAFDKRVLSNDQLTSLKGLIHRWIAADWKALIRIRKAVDDCEYGEPFLIED